MILIGVAQMTPNIYKILILNKQNGGLKPTLQNLGMMF